MSLLRSLFLRFAFAGLSIAAAPAFAAVPSDNVQVLGAVKTPMTLKVEDLEAFPADQISTATLTRLVDNKDVSSTVRGVKLSALLERAQLQTTSRHDWKHMAVIASADDGYRVVFSWPELSNTEIGAGVLVIFERDGQALSDEEGRIALVSARDTNTGPRHVKWLSHIEIKLL